MEPQEVQMAQAQQEPVQIDAGAVLRHLEETHPDAVRAAVWQVRAEMAEAEVATLRAQAAESSDALNPLDE
jgi:hypothetical protein